MSDQPKGDSMIVLKFEQHVHVRLGEWFAALVEASIGVLLFASPHMFENDELFSVMRTFAPQQAWAATAFLMGASRIVALYINGRKPITPYIRMGCAFLSCFVWWNFMAGVVLSGKPALSLATLPWLLVLDVYNLFRASADARIVYDKKRALPNGTEQT